MAPSTTEIFSAHRSILMAVAYRILGSVADAEDVTQEAWLRWADVDHDEVEDPKAYLIRIVSRLAIDKLRWAKTRRESYVGPWLPEPISIEPDAAEHAELKDSVELALLVVLEKLSPLERAVFVLREAFELPFAEIAEVIGRSEAATRQLGKRAREHVQEGRARFDVDRERRREITQSFLTASVQGDLSGLLSLLSADITLVSDGGGKARSPLRVLVGAASVGRFLTSTTTPEGIDKFMASIGVEDYRDLSYGVAEVNGAPAIVGRAGGRVITVISLVVVDGRVETVYLIANPEKLAALS